MTSVFMYLTLDQFLAKKNCRLLNYPGMAEQPHKLCCLCMLCFSVHLVCCFNYPGKARTATQAVLPVCVMIQCSPSVVPAQESLLTLPRKTSLILLNFQLLITIIRDWSGCICFLSLIWVRLDAQSTNKGLSQEQSWLGARSINKGLGWARSNPS